MEHHSSPVQTEVGVPAGLYNHLVKAPTTPAPQLSQSSPIGSEEVQKDLQTDIDLRTLLAGYITGSVVRLAVHPIDTIKARMQVIQARVSFGQMSQHSFRKVLLDSFRADGIKGLYRGFGVTVLVGGPATGLYFYTYEKSKAALNKYFQKDHSFLIDFMSGVIAEAVSCSIFVPVDVIKERQQVMSVIKSYRYKNTFDAIRQISRTEGKLALYKAYGATLMSFGPYNGLSLALYEYLKRAFPVDERSRSYVQSFFFCALSGSAAAIVTHPMDIVKVRMQVQRAENKGQPLEQGRFGYRNVFHGMAKLVRDEGPLALFKGLSARMMFGVLFSALHLSVNDWVKYKLLGTSKAN